MSREKPRSRLRRVSSTTREKGNGQHAHDRNGYDGSWTATPGHQGLGHPGEGIARRRQVPREAEEWRRIGDGYQRPHHSRGVTPLRTTCEASVRGALALFQPAPRAPDE